MRPRDAQHGDEGKVAHLSPPSESDDCSTDCTPGSSEREADARLATALVERDDLSSENEAQVPPDGEPYALPPREPCAARSKTPSGRSGNTGSVHLTATDLVKVASQLTKRRAARQSTCDSSGEPVSAGATPLPYAARLALKSTFDRYGRRDSIWNPSDLVDSRPNSWGRGPQSVGFQEATPVPPLVLREVPDNASLPAPPRCTPVAMLPSTPALQFSQNTVDTSLKPWAPPVRIVGHLDRFKAHEEYPVDAYQEDSGDERVPSRAMQATWCHLTCKDASRRGRDAFALEDYGREGEIHAL